MASEVWSGQQGDRKKSSLYRPDSQAKVIRTNNQTRENPDDLNHRDPLFAPTNQIRLTSERLRIHVYLPYVFHLPKSPFSSLPELLCDIVTTNRSAATLNHTVQLMSPFTESNAIRFRSALTFTSLFRYLQLDSRIGYSVCTNRCNIGCGIGSLLSTVTSHLLAVPNTESTNCYNLWLACL